MTDAPTPAPARRGPAPTKPHDILWAAARLFARRGVAQTGTREIAAEAGTTERTLFKHFGSKDALAQAVIERAVLPHLAPTSLAALRQAIDAHAGDLATWHAALLRQRAEALAQAPELVRLLAVELLRDEALRARFAEAWLVAAWGPLTGLFAALQREGVVARELAPELVARLFLSLNLGYLLGRFVLAPQRAWDDEAEIAAIVRVFARGVQP